jgi:glycosyltransferase involved in cell wall biosynthesis
MPRALYVITRAQRRGAEVDATLLAAELASEYEPLVVTLFKGVDPAVLGGRVPVHASAVEPGLIRRGLGVSIAAVRHVRTAIREFEPDLVVAYGGEPLLHAIPAAGRKGPPVLYVKISMSTDKLRRGPRRAAFRRACSRAGALAAVSPHLARELQQYLGADRQVHVTPTFRTKADIPPGRQREAVRRELGIADDQLLAAFVGNLSFEKGPDLALEAVAKARKRIHLLVAGEGPLAKSLESRATARDLAGRVRFLGARSDVPRLLAGADLVLSTSREEGRPGVILEAALGGLPVVAFAVGGIPDLVTHRREGLLIPPEDYESAAIAMNELLSDPGLRASLGAAALARSEQYLPGAVLPAWRAAYAATLRRAE